MKNVSFQINLSPFDYKLSKSLLPLQIEAFGDTLDEILLVLDLNPEKVTNDVKKDADSMVSFLSGLSNHDARIRVANVDYDNKKKSKIAQYFFNKDSMPLYDFRGAPIYPYYYGLYESKNDFVFHIDSDMFFGGKADNWIDIGIQFLESGVFSCTPLAGPPSADGGLVNQKYEKIGANIYMFDSFSTRIFFMDKRMLKGKLKLQPPQMIRRAYALYKNYPPYQTVEETIGLLMQQQKYKRLDFLGRSKGFWSLHPSFRSNKLYEEVENIWDKVQNGPYPEDQLGYYNFTKSFWDWGNIEKSKKLKF